MPTPDHPRAFLRSDPIAGGQTARLFDAGPSWNDASSMQIQLFQPAWTSLGRSRQRGQTVPSTPVSVAAYCGIRRVDADHALDALVEKLQRIPLKASHSPCRS